MPLTPAFGQMARGTRARRTGVGSTTGSATLPAYKPRVATIVHAAESLWDDGVKPLARILRKRVAELVPEVACEGVRLVGGMPDVDLEHLLAVCEESPQLQVEWDNVGQWCVLLKNRPGAEYVDVESNEDPYPDELWEQFAAYLERLERELPNSRYSCAYELRCRGLPFLEGLSLGEVMHIVRLASSSRDLLRYLDNALVPSSWRRGEMRWPAPAPPAALAGDVEVASLDSAVAALSQILAAERGPVPLSNVKRLLRTRHRLQLVERSFGADKLSDLLRMEPFSGMCEVRQEGSQPLVLPLVDPLGPVAPHEDTAGVEAEAADVACPSAAVAADREGVPGACGQDALNPSTPRHRISFQGAVESSSPTPQTPLPSPGSPCRMIRVRHPESCRSQQGPASGLGLVPTPSRCHGLVPRQLTFCRAAPMLPAGVLMAGALTFAIGQPQAVASLHATPMAGTPSARIAGALSAPTPRHIVLAELI